MYFIDVQGTLIDDINKQPIEGAVEFIDRLNLDRTPYMVVTNNTKKASSDFLEYLNKIGLNIQKSHYLDPLMLIESCVTKKSVAAYGAQEFLGVLTSMGYKLNYENPSEVVVAIKDNFNSEEYAQMIDFLLQGAKLTGMHETTIYAKNSKRYPGVGAILKMLEFATSVSYDVVGKPSDKFYKKALELLALQNENATFENITMISDDVKGDLVGASKFGVKTVFVLSGKYKNENEIIPFLKDSEKPKKIYKNIGEYAKTRRAS
ncbi:MAG: HAD-IIA family hydrolase [Helicobacteraceae bacterium]|nr:HAD-IIA family hydrolase [Helicobacteraceae bacterium]